MTDRRDIIARWVAREILPHEPLVRGWLARRWGDQVDADDLLQEAYCRIAALRSTDHIENGRAYLFSTVQSLVIDSFRRARLANEKAMTEIDWSIVEDGRPLPDREAEGRQELMRVGRLLSTLSQTCRRVIELRRLHGLSQKETAECLGISEHSVENHVTRGIRNVMGMLEKQDMRMAEREVEPIDPK